MSRGDGEAVTEIAAHAGGLRPLAGEQDGDHRRRRPAGAKGAGARAMTPANARPSQLPPGQARAPGEPRAETDDQQPVTLLQAALRHGVVQAQGDGGARGVAEPVEVEEDLLVAETELGGDLLDDAAILDALPAGAPFDGWSCCSASWEGQRSGRLQKWLLGTLGTFLNCYVRKSLDSFA